MNERFRYSISTDELNLWRKVFGRILDDLNLKIFFLLRENGRMSDTEIAKRLGVSATTVRRRRLFLQERGYLQVIGVLMLQELNLAYADVLVKFEKTASEKDIEQFINDAKQNYRIFEIAEYAGKYDVLLRFFEQNLHVLTRSVHEFISKYPYIAEYEILPITQSPKAFARKLK